MIWLNRYAKLVAAATALLIAAGGMVTSTGSGLSVPDWPNTYGWFMDDAATVATRARSGVTSPFPSGCTRFERNTTNIPVVGSIHNDVPVKPVWPNDPTGRSSPRFDEYAESMSHPRPRTLRSRGSVAAVVILATASGDRIRVPWYTPPSSSMPALAERADKADRRDAILRAAIETFAARGFFNAQVADVARSAGVAAGTVYLYFRSKDDLLISIFERTMKQAIAAGRESVASRTTPLDRLREIARLHLDRLGRNRDLAVVFQVELRQSTKFMERFSATYLREYLGIIRDVIAEGQQQGAFRAGINPTMAAKVLFGALDEMATNWILSRRRYSLAAEADAVVDLFVGGLAK